MASTNRPKRQFKKYPPEEVEPLVLKAQEGDLVSRDELLMRFETLIVSLVDVCVTARVNIRSRQVQLLKLFGRKDTPLNNTAHSLQRSLAKYSKDELYHTARLAAALAVERTNKNYASTIVLCFKELIEEMIKDDSSPYNLDEHLLEKTHTDETGILLDSLIQDLPEELQAAVEGLLDGSVKFSDLDKKSQRKLKGVFDYLNPP